MEAEVVKWKPYVTVISLVAFLCAALVVGVFLQRAIVFSRQALTLASEINTKGNALMPGKSVTIQIPKNDADELLFIPYGVSEQELEAALPGTSTRTRWHLLNAVSDNHPTAFVWIKEQRVLSINHVKIVIGMNSELCVWDLNRQQEIVIEKERESKNSFLSIELHATE